MGFGFNAPSLTGETFLRFGMCPRLGAILVFCAQPLYYLLTMADQKKTRRELLEAFVVQKPDDAFSRYGLAMECVNTGDTTAAESNFRELLQRNADYVPAYLMFAQMLVKESRPDDARQILQQGISAASKAGNGHALSEMEALLSEL